MVSHRQARKTQRKASDSNRSSLFHWTKFADVPVHGDALAGKADGDCRFFFENIDGFGVNVNNSKLSDKNIKYYNSLIQRLEVDFLGGAESRAQWDMLPRTHALPRLLNLREGSRSCSGHNVHERFSIKQQGGTFLAAMPQVGETVVEMGKDETGLGRWCWMKLTGQLVSTRVIVAYQPCVTRKLATSATLSQQKRYWRSNGNYTCPRKLFRSQLLAQLRTWRDQGDKLLLMLDGNENMQQGPLMRALQGEDLLMRDVVSHRCSEPSPATFIRGSRQIDAMWVTPDLQINRACFLPFNFAMGDHRGLVVDISQTSLLGKPSHRISRPTGRRLQCQKEETKQRYLNALETFCRRHRILQKLHQVFACPGHPSSVQTKLNSIDELLGYGMRHAEKRCRHLFTGEVPFSPEVAEAGNLVRLWSLVVRYRRGRNVNSRYKRRMAKKCSLKGVLKTPLATARRRKKQAWKQYNKCKKHARRLRDTFMWKKVEEAVTPAEQKRLKNIIKHEETRQSWGAINRARGKSGQQGVSSVQVQQDGDWVNLDAQEDVEEAIMQNNSKRFHLAASTPLMSAHMRDKIGFLAETHYAQQILHGKFTPDPLLDDHTNKFLSAIATTKSLSPISIAVTAKDFQSYWKSCRERTSSSLSNRHFGHYKASAFNLYLSEIHACMGHLALRHGTFLFRWSKGLTVMLEKEAGVKKVNKLRAILLMEADFNFLNKLIFGHRMVQQCEAWRRFPDELFGSRSHRSAEEVAVNRRLVIDGIKVMRCNGAIAGVDAAQCYDRIVHSMSSLLCQNEGVPIQAAMIKYDIFFENHVRR